MATGKQGYPSTQLQYIRPPDSQYSVPIQIRFFPLQNREAPGNHYGSRNGYNGGNTRGNSDWGYQGEGSNMQREICVENTRGNYGPLHQNEYREQNNWGFPRSNQGVKRPIEQREELKGGEAGTVKKKRQT